MSKIHITDRKFNSAGPAAIIAWKSSTNLKMAFAKKTSKLTDKLDCKRKTAAGYYRFKQLGFNNGDEIEDWLEAE